MGRIPLVVADGGARSLQIGLMRSAGRVGSGVGGARALSSAQFTLLLAAQCGPALEVEGSGGHAELEVSVSEAIAVGVTCAVVTNQSGDDAFDPGAGLHVLVKVVGQLVVQSLTLLVKVVADEDLAVLGRFVLFCDTGP